MGIAKLNVWFRDEKCRPYYNKVNTIWDWVTVENCTGESIIFQHPVPVGQAHVELEVPPGCYVVKGHVCGEADHINEATHWAIAIVGCGQEACVNLILPGVGTCVAQALHPIVQELVLQRVPDVEIARTSQLLMRAGRVSSEVMVAELQSRLKMLRTLEGTAKVAAHIEKTISFVKG
jgi:hypothetical protein